MTSAACCSSVSGGGLSGVAGGTRGRVEGGQPAGQQQLDHAGRGHAARWCRPRRSSCGEAGVAGAVPQLPQHRPADRRSGRRRRTGRSAPVPASVCSANGSVELLVEGDADEQAAVGEGADVGGLLAQHRHPQDWSTGRLTSSVTASGCGRVGRQLGRDVERRRRPVAGSPARAFASSRRSSSAVVPSLAGAGSLAHRDAVQRPDVDLVAGLERSTGPALTGTPLATCTPAGSSVLAASSTVAGRAGPRLHAEQPQELDLRGVRDLVEPVEHRLAEVGEQLEQRDARVALVVVGPFAACRRGSGGAAPPAAARRCGRRGSG